ncbi:MAG: hypothetical protein M1830_000220 [Pleopsidium flavum]|nr:MAG: hypothetical protein M1830_000220 [Pleopsidium flavum]
MESQNLQTASLYINNLLLSRGLLRNGKSIEFAKPSKAEEGKHATMAKIINLMHDLVLRRDREAEHPESLASTLRNLRTTETRQNLDISRLEAKNADLNRQLALAAGQQRAFKSTLRTAENSARSLREEMLRLKTVLQQVRTQCANDIRKRDLEIRRLKGHLTGQQRGKREGLGMSTIVIKPTATTFNHLSKSGELDGGEDLDSPDYSLRQETTEFLTQLSQGLSDENDNLIGLVRSTLTTLRNLQGLSVKSNKTSQTDHSDGSGQAGSVTEDGQEENALLALPTSYDTLSTDMDNVLEHLRTLLTNPSFVPIEEVEVREDEIVRLREGWEKMEGRWREALAMMDGWRKRMVNGGDTINLEELKMGLGLGLGLEGVAAAQDDSISGDEEADFSEQEDAQDEASDNEGQDSIDDEQIESGASPEHSMRDHNAMNGGEQSEETSSGVGLRPDGTILSESSGNARPAESPRKVSFTTIPEESTKDLATENNLNKLTLINAPISKPTSPRPSSFDKNK